MCLVRLERRENWGVVEALATHRSPSTVSPGRSLFFLQGAEAV